MLDNHVKDVRVKFAHMLMLMIYKIDDDVDVSRSLLRMLMSVGYLNLMKTTTEK